MTFVETTNLRAFLIKIQRHTFYTEVFHRVWKTQWKTELYMFLCMKKCRKTTKNVGGTSKTVDKPVETVENFMHRQAVEN
jgi:hypothetical protein